MNNKVTIIDIAKKSGVSPATVSRVLNNGNVNIKTKAKVLKTIKELNYEPNLAARNLSSSKKKKIAIIIKNFGYIYRRIILGISDSLNIYGYQKEIFVCNNEQEYESMIKTIKLSTEYMDYVDFVNLKNNDIFKMLKIKFRNDINEYNLCLRYNDDFLSTCVFPKYNKNEKNYIVDNLNIAAKVINENDYNKIYVLDECDQIKKLLPQITHLNLDFYNIGIYIGRILIKKINKENLEKEYEIII